MRNPADCEGKGCSIRSALVGVWKLAAYINHEEGKMIEPFGPRPRGLLIYTADGFVSAQLMNPVRISLASTEFNDGTPEEYAEISRGYIGYCGRYEVNEDDSTVVHVPEVALLPNLLDRPQKRQVRLSVDDLTLSTVHLRADGTSIMSQLNWSRVLN